VERDHRESGRPIVIPIQPRTMPAGCSGDNRQTITKVSRRYGSVSDRSCPRRWPAEIGLRLPGCLGQDGTIVVWRLFRRCPSGRSPSSVPAGRSGLGRVRGGVRGPRSGCGRPAVRRVPRRVGRAVGAELEGRALNVNRAYPGAVGEAAAAGQGGSVHLPGRVDQAPVDGVLASFELAWSRSVASHRSLRPFLVDIR
jgi:hypothetical protein